MTFNKGICPHCSKRKGQVGQSCPGEECAEQGYHFIPVEWYRSAMEFSRRKGRPMDPMLGRMVANFLLIGKLGEGGMGAVYLALQQPLDREVALKLISGIELTDTALSRFEREARSIALLEHPNIVKMYDYGLGIVGDEKQGFKVPYLALEYVRHGRTLGRALKAVRQENNGRIPGGVVLQIFTQVLNALDEAHNLGLIHRDMKPDNIMITSVKGNPHLVKLLDFGLAKAVSGVTGFARDVTHTGQLLGTPMYMALEQAMTSGKKAGMNHRVDLYAVAVMLYEIFTGRRPFEGDSGLAILMSKTDSNHRPMELPEALVLPRNLRDFLAKGMENDPERRFQSAGEMLDALRRVLTGQQVTGRGIAADQDTSSGNRPITPATPSAEDLPTMVLDQTDLPNSDSSVNMPVRGSSPWLYILGAVAVVMVLAGYFVLSPHSVPDTKPVKITAAAPLKTKPRKPGKAIKPKSVHAALRTETSGYVTLKRRKPESIHQKAVKKAKIHKKRPVRRRAVRRRKAKKKINLGVPLI